MRKLLPGMDNGRIFRPSIKSKIKVMKIRTMFLYIILAAIILQLTSCYTGRTCPTCGCGVWYPKKFNK